LCDQTTFGKNNMRRLLLATIILVTVVSVYVLSYRFSYLHQVRAGDNSAWQLVVAGIPLPYNDATRRAFSFLYSPLLEQTAAKRPGDDINGKIQRIDLSASELLVAREGKDGILIKIPSTMKSRLQDFSAGDTIHLTYRYRSMKDDPFCYSYELKTINHIAKQ